MKLSTIICLLISQIFYPIHLFAVEKLFPHIIAVYPHETSAFTQGLIAEGDFLYESCGLYHLSTLKKYELKTGKILNLIHLPSRYFGEGIAIVDSQLYQLTWKEQKVLIYDLKNFNLIKELPYTGEGWGLCNDGAALWMSNGTAQLVKRNRETFAIEKTLEVKLENHLVNYLNDLVCVDDHFYINVLNKDKILKVDKQSGKVQAIIDATQLLNFQQKKTLKPGAVLNGITYRSDKGTFLLTGKYWPMIFEVVFTKKPKYQEMNNKLN